MGRMPKMKQVHKPKSKRPSKTKGVSPNGRVTAVTVVLDRTGSMEACRDQTISGFNEWLGALKREANGQEYRLTLVKFDKHSARLGDKLAQMDIEVPYRGVPLEQVQPLTRDTYVPRGLTPLYDAIGQSISETEAVKADRVLFVIVTDGMENASTKHTRASIFDRIQVKQRLGTWSFVFIGANQDAYESSAAIGIPMGNTLQWDPLKTGQTWGRTAVSTTTYIRSQNPTTVDFWKGQS